jgi:hypothetical protein
VIVVGKFANVKVADSELVCARAEPDAANASGNSNARKRRKQERVMVGLPDVSHERKTA